MPELYSTLCVYFFPRSGGSLIQNAETKTKIGLKWQIKVTIHVYNIGN